MIISWPSIDPGQQVNLFRNLAGAIRNGDELVVKWEEATSVIEMVNLAHRSSKEGEPHAVLIRAIDPIEGKEIMLQRTGKQKWEDTITSGPGRVGKAFGFHTSQCGLSLVSNELYIADDDFNI